MNQLRYILLAVFLLFVFSGFYWVNEQLRISSAHTLPPVAASSAAAVASGPALPGKSIFQQNCASCHALDKPMTGPGLAGVGSRGPWTDRKKLYAWVHNPAAFMLKDPYTQELKKQFTIVMQAFPQLSEKEIDQVVEYVDKK